MLAAPMAKPTTPLPKIMPKTFEANVCRSAPIVKSTSAVTITHFRPHLSARTPATGLTSKAQKLVLEVIRDLSRVVNSRFERSDLIDTRVLEITPVLYRCEPCSAR